MLVCLSPYENREAGWATMPPTNAAVGHHYTTVALNDESHGATELESRMREGAVRVSEGRYQLRTFGVESSLLKVVGGARLVE